MKYNYTPIIHELNRIQKESIRKAQVLVLNTH